MHLLSPGQHLLCTGNIIAEQYVVTDVVVKAEPVDRENRDI